MIVTREVRITTRGRGFVELTAELNVVVGDSGVRLGLCALWIRHTSASLPIRHGRLTLGTWQGVLLWEHRLRGQQRRVDVTLLGE